MEILLHLILFHKLHITNETIKGSTTKPKYLKQDMQQHVYCCAECGETKTNAISPSSDKCPESPFHRWINMGVKGDAEYICRHCKAVVRTVKIPVTYGCKENLFHEWQSINVQ